MIENYEYTEDIQIFSTLSNEYDGFSRVENNAREQAIKFCREKERAGRRVEVHTTFVPYLGNLETFITCIVINKTTLDVKLEFIERDETI